MLTAFGRRSSLVSSAMASAYSVHRGAANGSQFTVTALGRWSILNKPLPPVDKIKSLHVYDFDNTLFKTPLPNPALWNGGTIGMLSRQDVFVNGGWWHDSKILAATGEGAHVEEPRAWEGWWNETIVELVRLSIKQPDALCVLLTGRSEQGFADIIKRMVTSKGLDVDLIGLKPQVSPSNQRFESTMHFKQLFLQALMETYSGATDIKIYEDRPKHTKGFREFFAEYNRRQNLAPTRGPLTAEVVQVADASTTLDPVIEVAEVQNMVNMHNDMVARQPYGNQSSRLKLKRTVVFTSYMIGLEDSQKLVALANLPLEPKDDDLVIRGGNIVISPRPCPVSVLKKVGGMGSTLKWQVTAIGSFENSIWAARVQPVPVDAQYHTDNPVPLVVLALRKGARPTDAAKIVDWVPIAPEKSFVFDSVVGEKIFLRVETENGDDNYGNAPTTKGQKRKHAGDGPGRGDYGGRGDTRGYHSGGRGGGQSRGGRANYSGRGNRNTSRGGRGGRGRGGGFNYRSLDDVGGPKNAQGGYGPQVNYDDIYQPPNQAAYAQQQQQTPQGRPIGTSVTNGTDLQDYY